MKVSIYTDGGARGNPGPAGFGLIIANSLQKIIFKQARFLGIKTNNQAEYAAFVAALSWLKSSHQSLRITAVDFYSDSQLIIRQLNGSYKIKAKNLIPLYTLCQKLLSQIPIRVNFCHIRRHYNQLADSLANQAMDGHEA